MQRLTKLAALGLLAPLAFPGALRAQNCNASDVHTRSVALNMRQAQTNSNAQTRARLYREALEAANRGMEAAPGNPQIWLLGGQANIQVGNTAEPQQALELYTAADRAFTRAMEMCPQDFAEEITRDRNNAWTQAYNAGITAQNRGEDALAILHLERAEVISRGRPEPRFYLGQLYHRTGDTDKAIASYQTALELLLAPAPGGAQGARAGGAAAGGRGGAGAGGRGGGLAGLGGRGGFGGAGAGMNPAERQQMAQAAAFNLAQIFSSTSRFEEAVEAYRRLIQVDPTNVAARMNLAVTLSRLNRHDEAAEIYVSLLADDSLDAYDLFTMGVGLFQASMYELAAQAFEKAGAKNPHMRDAPWYALQTSYQLLDGLEKAHTEAAEADKTAAAEKLHNFLTHLAEVGDKVLALDPLNRNAAIMQARAFQGLMNMATEDAVKIQWSEKLQDRIHLAQEGMTFFVPTLRSGGNDRVQRIQGRLENATHAAGENVTLRFSFVGENGAVLGTRDVTIAVPAEGAEHAANFELEYQSESATIAGWKYEVVK
jgi:tetratricopeptide (TPR) repeat protein